MLFFVVVVVAVVSPLNLTFLIMQLFNLAVCFFFPANCVVGGILQLVSAV